MKLTNIFLIFVILGTITWGVESYAYESIPLSKVPPFYASRCGGTGNNFKPNLIFYLNNNADTRTQYLQNPGPDGNDPTTYNNGLGVENLFWFKWANYVFKIAGTQANSSIPVKLEIITNLSYASADAELGAAGLSLSQISTLRTTGSVNPAGDANRFFTGRWVGSQAWVRPLQRPASTPPGNDCPGATWCLERWLNENTTVDLDGPNTALVTPMPTEATVFHWEILDSLRTRPTIRQSLVAYPKWCDDTDLTCYGGVIFTADDPLSTKIAKLRALWPSPNIGGAPVANGLEEMLRWLANAPSYNLPGSTYCQAEMPCSPLTDPGDSTSQFSVIMMVGSGIQKDCRIPPKQPTSPYSGEPDDVDGDGGHDPNYPDYNAAGDHCDEVGGGTFTTIPKTWLADDMAYKLRETYPKASLLVTYLPDIQRYWGTATCASDDLSCLYAQAIADDKPTNSTTANSNTIVTRWSLFEKTINDAAANLLNVETTLPSFGGTCSTFVALRNEWLVPLTNMASYTSQLYRLKPDANKQLTIPPADADVIWELGAILRSVNADTLKVKTTLNGQDEIDFSPNNSGLVAELFTDDPNDLNDPDWSAEWNTEDEIENAIKYIRGSNIAGMRERSFPDGNTLITPWPVGEIFSPPIVVGPPRSGMNECFVSNSVKKCYSDFASANKNRIPMVIVATGDGQLRVLNYDTGHQLYSFIPKAALQALEAFPSSGYSRTSYVSGTVQAFDVYDSQDAEWKTILIAGMAQGGSDYFALDITDPSNVKFMFEVQSAAVGNSFSPVVSVRLKDVTLGEKFIFVAGSGYNNTADENGSTAEIIAFDLRGNVLKTLRISDQLGNGTTSVYAQDSNDDGTIDSLLVGTYKGELIEVKTPGTSFGNWTVARTLADIVRPITAPVRMNRVDGQRYYFGVTGKLLTEDDLSEDPPPQEYFFAFRDTGSTITLEDLTNYTSAYREVDDKDDSTPNQRFITIDPDTEQNKVGYKISFPSGHRGINPVMTMADGVMFPTTNPVKDSQCTYGGRSLTWYVSQKLNPKFINQKGDAIPYLDVNGDQKIDSQDTLNNEYPSAKETTSATFNLNPQIDMKKSTLDVVTVELYSNVKAADGNYYATVGHTIFQNRLRGIVVNWKESTKIKQ
jgi:hypothetical protein